ncbi:MAG: response regulator [Clostridiales Family XIII bacterium]|jgi:YesN/AraC family two-component response regulator|nr:response regulator [Clostridiales Family XIII bacterium]
MIKVLVVEDEPLLARVLAKLISANPSFEALGVVYDGQAALERIAEGGVDAVFTDIRMPVMDGLELMRRMYALYPHIPVVILTGYPEFSYAKEAITYKAFDYVLKPLSYEKVGEALARLEKEHFARTRDRRQRAFLRVLRGENIGAEVLPDCMAAILCAGALCLSEPDIPSEAQMFWEDYDLEESVEKIAMDKGSFFVFNGLLNAEKLIVAQHIEPADMESACRRLFGELNQNGKHIPVTLIGYNSKIAPSELHKTARRLNTALGQCMTLYDSKFVWSDLSRETAAAHSVPGAESVEKAVEAICAQDAEKLNAVLMNTICAYKGNMPQKILLQFLDEIRRDKRLVIGWDQEPAKNAVEFENVIFSASDNEQLCAALQALLLAKRWDNKQSMRDTVSRIEEYLIANYNKPVTHNMLASQFGFVSSYISKMFRKHRGVSPSEFLTKYRVEKAKEIMDSRSDVLIKDIAVAVGYPDYFYFSKIFKKETGLWPKDYVAMRRNTPPVAVGAPPDAGKVI